MSGQRGYARNEGFHIAFEVSGEGTPVVLYLGTYTLSIDSVDDEPHAAHFRRRLASFCRLIEYDRRGVGLSDPIDPNRPITIEQLAADAMAVMDAAGVEHVAVIAETGAAPVGIHLAARHPDRVDSLVVVNGYARFVLGDDYPIGVPEETVRDFLSRNMDPDVEWDSAAGDEVAVLAPSLRNDPEAVRWWVRAGQRGASPAAARAIVGASALSDARELLPLIHVPTLVLHRMGNLFVPSEMGRYIADHIEGARWVELSGADNVAFAGDADALLDEVEVFLTGSIGAGADRALTTVLFTDIVDSTATAARLGDQQWRATLDRHDLAVRAALRRFGGHEVNTTGDGFVGTFDTPTQAVRGAHAIIHAAQEAGVAVRVGVHTGEVEVRGDDVAGIAVHLAARVGALAGPGEVWVSRTVHDLVTGAGFRFVDRGEHQLKGIAEPWRLFQLEA